MSCVRRMCRILVDCDDNTLSRNTVEKEEEEDEPPMLLRRRRPKKYGKVLKGMETPPVVPGTGTVAVAYCWRDIVFVEVSKVSDRSASPLAPREVYFVHIYIPLTGAFCTHGCGVFRL